MGPVLGQLGCILGPPELPWVDPSRGPVSHFPRPRGLSQRCLPLLQCCLCSAGFPSPPFPPRGVANSGLEGFKGHRLRVAQRWANGCCLESGLALQKASVSFLASCVPCPLRAQPSRLPTPLGKAPPPCQVVGVQPQEHGSWTRTRREGGWMCSPGRHHPSCRTGP